MASSHDNLSMAVFCDFENVALGVRDANFEKFDIKPVLEKLLLKGSIVVKKAYCDWDRYKGFKAIMHEANFELIEIPHVRQSGKNSADIRMVVDALDLCYTKSHVNTFVIISGDSDFSPLVSKLRENAKQVIGVGVKQSTSDLLVANCDEFIFYDDLVRERQRQAARRQPPQQQPKRSAEESSRRKEEQDSRKAEAIEMVVETFDALTSERGDSGKIWASLLKDTLKRRRPDFNETYFGFRTFGNLLEEAQARGLLEFGRDEKSGAYVYRPSGTQAGDLQQVQQMHDAEQGGQQDVAQAEAPSKGKGEPRRRTRGGRKSREEHAEHDEAQDEPVLQVQEQEPEQEFQADEVAAETPETGKGEPRRRNRGGRKSRDERAEQVEVQEPELVVMPVAGDLVVTAVGEPAVEAPAEETEAPRRRTARKAPARKAKAATKAAAEVVEAAPVEVAPEPAAEAPEAAPKSARKPAARPRRPAKPKA